MENSQEKDQAENKVLKSILSAALQSDPNDEETTAYQRARMRIQRASDLIELMSDALNVEAEKPPEKPADSPAEKQRRNYR